MTHAAHVTTPRTNPGTRKQYGHYTSPDRLRQIAGMVDVKMQISQSNMEALQHALGEMVDFAGQLIMEDTRHLGMVEFQEGHKIEHTNGDGKAKAFDAYETAQNTLRERTAQLAGLVGGRAAANGQAR